MSVPQVLLLFVVCLLQDAFQQTPGQIIDLSPPQQHKVGDNAVLVCTVTDLMQQPVVWLKDNSIIAKQDVITTGDRRVYASRNPSVNTYYLTIRGVEESDSGVYKCGVTDRNQQVATSRETRIIVAQAQPHYPQPQPQPHYPQPQPQPHYPQPQPQPRPQPQPQPHYPHPQPQPRPQPQPQPQPQRWPHPQPPPKSGVHSGGLADNRVITNVSPSQIKNVGDAVVLSCSVSDIANVRGLWLTDDGTSVASDDTVYSHDPRFRAHKDVASSTFILNINNVQDKDSGIYKCSIYARGHPTPDTREIRLEVRRPPSPIYKVPRIIYISQPQTRNAGDEAVLSCRVQDAGDHPVVWTKDGIPISTDEDLISTDRRYHISVDENTESYHLKIENVQASDSGVYVCEVLLSPRLPTSKVSQSVTLRVNPTSQPRPDPRPYPSRVPSIISISGERIHTAGQSTALACTVQNAEGSEVLWMKDNRVSISRNGELLVRDPRFRISQDGLGSTYTIQISDLQDSDAGTYSCVVFSPTTGRVSKDVPVRIIPRQDPGPFVRIPKIVSVSNERVVRSGDSTSISCTVENAPDTDVSWVKDYKTTITTGADMRIREPRFSVSKALDSSTFTLTLTNLQESDSGIYSCVLNSEAIGRLSEDVPVKVIRNSGPAVPTITSISTDRAQNIGDSTTLTCKVENAQNSQVMWMKDGQATIAMNDRLLLQDRRFRISVEADGSHHLYIENVQPQDFGTYSCVVRSRGDARISKEVVLRVHSGSSVTVTPPIPTNPPRPGVPTIIEVSGPRVKNVGQYTTISCLVENIENSPKAQVVWTKDGTVTVSVNDRIYIQDPRFRLSKNGNSYDLSINYLQEQDSGTYSCVLYAAESGRQSKDVSVRVSGHSGHGGGDEPGSLTKPSIAQRSSQAAGYVGARVDLSCTAINADGIPLIWRKLDPRDPDRDDIITMGAMRISPDSRFSVQYIEENSTYILSIGRLRFEDEGDYRCEIPVSEGETVAGNVEVRVIPIPRPEPRPDPRPDPQPNPRPAQIFFHPNSSDVVSANENDVATLECYAGGIPSPRVTWSRPDGQLLPNGGTSVVGNVLMIPSVEDIHAGLYICTADNGYNQIQKQVQLNVQFAPLVIPIDLDIIRPVGEPVEIRCEIHANPQAYSIIWLKDNAQIVPSAKFTKKTVPTEENVIQAVLQIARIDRNDYGEYTCRATNNYGSDEAKTEVREDFPVDSPVPDPGLIPSDLGFIPSDPGFIPSDPGSVPSSPSVTVEPSQYTIPPHFSIDLECNATGSPTPSVVWYKDNAYIENSPHYRIENAVISETNVTSLLRVLSLEDGIYGSYVCIGSNSAGTDQTTIELIPKINAVPTIPPPTDPSPAREYGPRIEIDGEPQRVVAENSNIDLRCRVQASPRADIYWYKDYQPIKENPYVRIENSTISAEEVASTLHIYSVQGDHYGTYTCRARNRVGIDQEEVDIQSEQSGYTTYPPPVGDDSDNCNLDDKFLEAVSTKIADRITIKVINNLDQIGAEYNKLEQVVNELQNEYQNIDREIKLYYNRP